jgi:hypothetical protein
VKKTSSTLPKNEHDLGYAVNSLEKLQAIATAFNCELYKGAEDELLLDIDRPFREFHFDSLPAKQIIGERFNLFMKDAWRSRNGMTHVVCKIENPLPPLARIALQAVLGSDPKREALALYEFLVEGTDTISLFKPKEKK